MFTLTGVISVWCKSAHGRLQAISSLSGTSVLAEKRSFIGWVLNGGSVSVPAGREIRKLPLSQLDPPGRTYR